MTDRLLAILAFVVLLAFLGILVTKVQRTDLWIVVGLTVALVVVDFFIKTGKKR